MTLTQIPENLIFYEDEEMTTALLKENGKIHLDGYFGASDTNKTATKNLYWQWKLETGSTQTEIDANDLLDSNWIGERITLGIVATGRQVVDNPATQYAVTFDLNGGTLANHGDSTQVTKQVAYGEAYGDLPVPTRTGYRFVGWNGKNLYNVDNRPNNNTSYTSPGVTKGGNDWITINTSSASLYYNFITCDLDVESNKTYTIITEIKEVSNVTGDLYITSTYQGSGQFSDNIMVAQRLGEEKIRILNRTPKESWQGNAGLRTFYYNKNRNTNELLTFRISVLDLDDSITKENFKYEPYIINSLTEVTQNKNHTLTAIWEPISN